MPCVSSDGQENTAVADSHCGKTSLEPSAATAGMTLASWLDKWQVRSNPKSRQKAGALKAPSSARKEWSNGQCSTRSGSEWRSGAAACSLSQILETGPVGRQYFLSPRACAGILRRAEKRGKAERLAVAVAVATAPVLSWIFVVRAAEAWA